jgi:hypothetical protein
MQNWRGSIFSNRQLGMRVNQDSDDNGVRLVNFTTSNNLVVKSTIFLH